MSVHCYCLDIDECAQGTDGCHQICENLEGSFQCNCSVGLELDVDDMTCIGKLIIEHDVLVPI